MNCYKLISELNKEYLCRSDELLTQIENEVKNYQQIQLMIFFKGINHVMKQKICKHPEFSNSCEDLITLTKKLCLSIETETHSQTITANTNFSESISAKPVK